VGRFNDANFVQMIPAGFLDIGRYIHNKMP